MIEIQELKKIYGSRTVLDIDSLVIPDGMKLALAGPNGSGKSTFIKILAGIIKQTSGKILSEGRVLYMPQTPVAFNKTVINNLLYSLKGNKKDNKEKCMEALKSVGLDNFYDKNALSLSGGEKQRLSLARLLVLDADILLLDEPTGAVDVEGAEIIEAAVEKYVNKNKCTLIFATHSPKEAKNLSDKIMMLKSGVPEEFGTAEELTENPGTEWGRKFIDMWRI